MIKEIYEGKSVKEEVEQDDAASPTDNKENEKEKEVKNASKEEVDEEDSDVKDKDEKKEDKKEDKEKDELDEGILSSIFRALFGKKEVTDWTIITHHSPKHRKLVDELSSREGKFSYYYYEVYLAFKQWLSTATQGNNASFELVEFDPKKMLLVMKVRNSKGLIQPVAVSFTPKGVSIADGRTIPAREFRDQNAWILLRSAFPPPEVNPLNREEFIPAGS